jgi:hypothetical protein
MMAPAPVVDDGTCAGGRWRLRQWWTLALAPVVDDVQSPDEKDDDELLKIDRPAHQRIPSFHVQAHLHCEYCSTDWTARLKLVHTSIQEQTIESDNAGTHA